MKVRLVDGRAMTDWHPPERQARSFELGEPLLSISQDLNVRAPVDVFSKVLTKPAITGLSSGPFIRAMFTWARCSWFAIWAAFHVAGLF